MHIFYVLKLPDITSKFHVVTINAVVNVQTVFLAEFLGVLLISMELNMPSMKGMQPSYQKLVEICRCHFVFICRMEVRLIKLCIFKDLLPRINVGSWCQCNSSSSWVCHIITIVGC
jgi:hypothetical protein